MDNHDKFARIAMTLAVLSIISAVTLQVYLPLILGSIAIILAILSKGQEPALRRNAKSAIACGTIGIVLDAAIIGVCVYLVVTVPAYHKQFDSMFKQMYGETFEEMIQDYESEDTSF